MPKRPRPALFLLCLYILIFAYSPAAAQLDKYNYDVEEGTGFNSGTRFLLGYAVNIPNQYLGFTLGFTRPKTWGIFLDYKMDYYNLTISPYLYDYTPEYVEQYYTADTLIDSYDSWATVNAGITKPISDHLCAYLGLGLSFHKAYLQYYEPYKNMGDNGYYWINDDANSAVNLNVSGGVYYKFGRYLYLQLGGEIRPLGLVAGLGLAP